MKRAVLFPNPYKNTMASARIAKFVADELDVELWDSPEKIVYEPIDELYFVYGLVAFSKFREEMGALAPFVRKYIFIENDFTGCHLTQLRKPLAERGIVPIFLTTCPHRLERQRGYYLNWNQYTWDPVSDALIKPSSERIPALVYYGAFRPDRENYFQNYFGSDLFDTHIFSGKGGQRKFSTLGPRVICHDQAQDLNLTLNDYSCTLYIEDNFSHRRYSSVANRFYECLAAGIPILFDKDTIRSMDLGGFKIMEEWVVSNAEDLQRYIDPEVSRCVAENQAPWREVPYRDWLRYEFHQLLPKIAACDPMSTTCVE